MGRANWVAFQQALSGGLNTFLEKQKEQQKRQQEFSDALSLYMAKSMIEQRMKSLYPDTSDLINQLKLQESLRERQQKQQFQRMGNIGFGRATPTQQEVLPMVPQKFQQRFIRRSVGPPSLKEALAAKIRQPYEQAGYTLVPDEQGWEKVKVGIRQTADPLYGQAINLAKFQVAKDINYLTLDPEEQESYLLDIINRIYGDLKQRRFGQNQFGRVNNSIGAPQIKLNMPISQSTRNPNIANRINQLRNSGWKDQDIANALREKGIEPSVYNLR